MYLATVFGSRSRFYVYERVETQDLMWLSVTEDGKPESGVGRQINDEDAEALTGLHMPAAMDRLRELVHESGGSS